MTGELERPNAIVAIACTRRRGSRPPATIYPLRKVRARGRSLFEAGRTLEILSCRHERSCSPGCQAGAHRCSSCPPIRRRGPGE